MPCTLNRLPWRTFRRNRETGERVQEATGQGQELSTSFQHRDVGVTPLASRLGNGPPSWKSTTKRSEEISVRGKVSKWICLRVSPLLLWLSVTCKEKFAGGLEGAGTYRETCPAVVQDTEGPGGKFRDRRRT